MTVKIAKEGFVGAYDPALTSFFPNIHNAVASPSQANRYAATEFVSLWVADLRRYWNAGRARAFLSPKNELVH